MEEVWSTVRSLRRAQVHCRLKPSETEMSTVLWRRRVVCVCSYADERTNLPTLSDHKRDIRIESLTVI